jgi:hypothetical protein
MTNVEKLQDLAKAGLTFGECAAFFGERQAKLEPGLTAYANAVPTNDELETDEHPIVSAGGDGGAFVMCWKWVSDEAAGIEDDEDDPHQPCDECGEEHPEGVLDDGLCPSCGDKED